jgi:hypothetical protein
MAKPRHNTLWFQQGKGKSGVKKWQIVHGAMRVRVAFSAVLPA